MPKPLCIYHGDCDDGFAAAWVVRAAAGSSNFAFYPGVHQQPPPDVAGRHVLIVDFSYKRPVLLGMAATARSIVVLDHHKTAAEDLAGFPRPAPFRQWQDGHDPRLEGSGGRIAALFDMDRSGAGMCWDFFFAARPRPLFIDYIEDRDLWRKALPSVDEFTIALRSYPQDFDVWDQLVQPGPGPLIAEGKSIQRYFRLRVEEAKRSGYKATLDGMPCWAANAPRFLASEVASELADRGLPFAFCYCEVVGGRFQYELRSRSDFDVSEVAKRFGGGGHKQAAGFMADAPVHALLR